MAVKSGDFANGIADSGFSLCFSIPFRKHSQRKFFVKLKSGHSKSTKMRAAFLRKRERTTLQTLKKLAVPQLAKTHSQSLRAFFKKNRLSLRDVIICNWIEAVPSSEVLLKPEEAVGVWLFVLEQLCSFRRKGILYTDLKPSHILISKDLSEAFITDFDFALPLQHGPSYPKNSFGITPSFMAPETFFSPSLLESSLVYTAGLLLCALLIPGTDNSNLQSLDRNRALKKITKGKNAALIKVIEKAVAFRPDSRYQNYEKLFLAAQKAIRAENSLKIWARLRSPYISALR